MPVTLDAREATLLYLWPRELILPMLIRNGQASWELSCLVADRMQRASVLVEGLAFHPVAGRLARLLLEHFSQAGDSPISRYLTLGEMAAHWFDARDGLPCLV